MTKKDLASLTFSTRQLAQINDSSLDKLTTVLEASFSAIATADPKMALSILDQLVEQREAIANLATEREADEKKFVDTLSSRLPPVLEFDEEDQDNEGMN